MLIILDRRRIHENCEAVGTHAKNTHGSLKARYSEGLKDLLKTPMRFESKHTTTSFCPREWNEFLTAKNVISRDDTHVMRKLSPERIQRLKNEIAAMRSYLMLVNPRIVELLDLLVAELIILQVAKPEAGSHSAAIGVIYVNADEHWSIKYWAEIVFHELLHIVFFLEDMTRGVMQDMELLEREDTRAYSAVRKTTRYFDSAFHAAFVTAGMMWFYNESSKLVRGGHTAKIAECMTLGRKAVADLKRVVGQQEAKGRPILTANGNKVLASIAGFFEAPDFESISSLLEV